MLLSPEDILLQQIGQASCEVFVVLVQHTSILFILWHSAFFWCICIRPLVWHTEGCRGGMEVNQCSSNYSVGFVVLWTVDLSQSKWYLQT